MGSNTSQAHFKIAEMYVLSVEKDDTILGEKECANMHPLQDSLISMHMQYM